jgi:hypothetical protein
MENRSAPKPIGRAGKEAVALNEKEFQLFWLRLRQGVARGTLKETPATRIARAHGLVVNDTG